MQQMTYMTASEMYIGGLYPYSHATGLMKAATRCTKHVLYPPDAPPPPLCCVIADHIGVFTIIRPNQSCVGIYVEYIALSGSRRFISDSQVPGIAALLRIRSLIGFLDTG